MGPSTLTAGNLHRLRIRPASPLRGGDRRRGELVARNSAPPLAGLIPILVMIVFWRVPQRGKGIDLRWWRRWRLVNDNGRT